MFKECSELWKGNPMKKEPVSISGIWCRKIGHNVEVLVEIEGEWRLVITEPVDNNFGHIVEPCGMLSSPKDYIT